MYSIYELDDCNQNGSESIHDSGEAESSSFNNLHSHLQGPQSKQSKQLPTANANMLKGENEMMMDIDEFNTSNTTTTPQSLSTGLAMSDYYRAPVTDDSDDSKPPASSPPRKVNFFGRSKHHRIPHINDIPPDVIASTWYNRGEFDDIKKSYQITIRMIMKGHTFTTQDEATNAHCIRGLEHRTREGARFKQKVKVFAMSAVLDEQERQRQEGIKNPELIAQHYRQESDNATSRALALGLKDELDIQDYLRAEEMTTRTASSSCSLEEGDENERVDNNDSMVDISLEPCSESNITSRGRHNDRRPEDSSGGHSFRYNPADVLSFANLDLSPTKEQRNRLPILSGLNQSMPLATSSRRQQVLDTIEAARKENKRSRRHMVGATA